MTKTIYFDMDGTIADLYGQDNWLSQILAERTTPYRSAKGINLQRVGKALQRAQKAGYRIGIISWTAKNGSPAYNSKTAQVKRAWLKRHLSITFDEIHILPYGTPKWLFRNENDILFDDEEQNRKEWGANAYEPTQICKILGELI